MTSTIVCMYSSFNKQQQQQRKKRAKWLSTHNSTMEMCVNMDWFIIHIILPFILPLRVPLCSFIQNSDFNLLAFFGECFRLPFFPRHNANRRLIYHTQHMNLKTARTHSLASRTQAYFVSCFSATVAGGIPSTRRKILLVRLVDAIKPIRHILREFMGIGVLNHVFCACSM